MIINYSEYKRIGHYIFNWSKPLGKGSFGKVYPGYLF